MSSFKNPILPGFYPDPSCIRVGDTFYMVTSSFQFFPGIPIHMSKDLVNWEIIGNAINRPSQLDLSSATTKINNPSRREIFTGGIYAPTIRYHKGSFYIVCTMLSGSEDMRPDEDFHPTNFIITSDDLHNPDSFSELIYFDFHGIDPSLVFDDDGKVYLQGSYIHGYSKTPATVIRQAQIDLATGNLLSNPIDIWTGATGKVPEGPHIYKKDGWYYLLIAEGGTHRRHKITMARARDISGPYESCDRNPVLTAEGSQGIIQCVGHGDLFQDVMGDWWCVMLARREYGASYPLGRETFLTSVRWMENEFPVFKPVEIDMLVGKKMAEKSISDEARAVELASPLTLYLRTPDLDAYRQDAGDTTLMPTATNLAAPSGTVTFVGQRQTELDSVATATLILDDNIPGDVSYGLTVYKDPFRYVAIEYSTSGRSLSLQLQEAGHDLVTLSSYPIADATLIVLTVTSSVERYIFRAESITLPSDQHEQLLLGEIPCSAMSGDDFTGTIYAIYATGDTTPVIIRDFKISN
ncbi:putative xylosidase/arabinosidase [Aspergillus stella-maris]|uniref:putative xylosidase/arabinosidase n=1 Tax=Aspergillus stella-maris TaxID=1810926 RepID=UPI003CCD28F1